MEEASFNRLVQPLRGRGRYQLLRGWRKVGQKGIPALGVKLAENVIQQQQRRRTGFYGQNPRLCELQSQRNRSLLTFGSVLLSGNSLHGNLQVIAVRANDGLPQTKLLHARTL